MSLSVRGGDKLRSGGLITAGVDAESLINTYSLSSWRLWMKKMMPTMMPMKAREPRIPPMTAPVGGPGVICLSSERERKFIRVISMLCQRVWELLCRSFGNIWIVLLLMCERAPLMAVRVSNISLLTAAERNIPKTNTHGMQ